MEACVSDTRAPMTTKLHRKRKPNQPPDRVWMALGERCRVRLANGFRGSAVRVLLPNELPRSLGVAPRTGERLRLR